MTIYERSGGYLVTLCILAFLAGACLQLETPHTFIEEEDIRARKKNLHQYYLELEEAIRLEKYQIKLLEHTLSTKITEGQAKANEIQARQAEFEDLKKDLANLTKEVEKLNTQLADQQKKRKGLEGNLKAEQDKTAGIQKSIALEAGRIGEARAGLSQYLSELEKIEKEIQRLQGEIPKKKKALESLKKEGAALDAELKKKKPEPKPETGAAAEKKSGGS